MKIYVVNHVLSDTEGAFESKKDAEDFAKKLEDEFNDDFRVKEIELTSEKIQYSIGDTIEFSHMTNEGEKTMVGLIFAYDWRANRFVVYVDRDNDAVRVYEKEIVKRIKKYGE